MIAFGVLLTSCINEEKYSEDTSLKLVFSADTVTFDTILTTVGSVTKQIRVFNPSNKAVKLDYITLGGGGNSAFRLNADGDTSLIARNIVIGAKDSVFVFIRTELEPNNQNNPLLIEDSIIFAFNKKQQSVILMAYGQDAYYHLPTRTLNSSDTPIAYSLANDGGDKAGVVVNGNNITWKNDKPHVIIGTCAVDSVYTLNLTDNTVIYMGNNADFWVYSDATLKAQGTLTNPVVFQSLRMQGRYASIPGQWGKIWFWVRSKDNVLDNVKIKNATIGVIVDSCVNENPTISMNNVSIENCSQLGLYSRGSNLYATNLMIQNTGSYSLALTLGGSYEFIGCTFANYWSYDNTRNQTVLLLNDWYEASEGSIQYRPISKCNFYNCIIYGSLLENEIEFDLLNVLQNPDNALELQNIYFDHCLIKSTLIKNNNNNIRDCIFNKDPMFNDVTQNDLHILKTSAAKSSGNSSYNAVVPYDIFGVLRSAPPAIGAAEYTEQ